MRDILRQIARGVVIGLAIPGAVFLTVVVMAAVLSLYQAWTDPAAPDTLLCRNQEFDPSDPNSRQFIPCDEDQAKPLATTNDKPVF